VTGAILLFLLRDGAGYAERCEQGRRVSAECGYTWWSAFFEVLLGRLPITAAPTDEGIERMRRGIAEWQGVGMHEDYLCRSVRMPAAQEDPRK